MARANAKTSRDHIRETLDTNVDMLMQRLLNNTDATKRTRVACEHCHKAFFITVADVKASTDAIDKLVAMGYGRQTGPQGAQGSFILERRIVKPEDEAILDSGVPRAPTLKEQNGDG